MAEDEHEGASIQEQLIAACRGNNTDLLEEILEDKPDDVISKLLNETVTVLGNHLYHEAALRGHYEVIDFLLDQPDFECDPVTRIEGDTPLHSVIRWLNDEPAAQRPFGKALVEMMLEAGSNPRARNRQGVTPWQLVDPSNQELRDVIKQHEFASQNAGDYVNATPAANKNKDNDSKIYDDGVQADDDESDDDAEFSGSDDDERAEWERRRKEKRG
ncbi:ANK protein [Geosmithia morbida]|uniref:ANK protein n=1 Tax=Geosmithia morbida TaxID=1094350 RepID=A0A9P4YX92_9HYPO|nr:ANK protein [Geosmithia morbida]KAF4124761.1 ANK protein [Geosmithia morbida]